LLLFYCPAKAGIITKGVCQIGYENHRRNRACCRGCWRTGVPEDQAQTQVNTLGGVYCRPLHIPSRKEIFEMIEGMESFIGRKLNNESIGKYKQIISDMGFLPTSPKECGTNISINMMIFLDADYVITKFEGNKTYCYSKGLYNRSSSVKERSFSKKDIDSEGELR